MTSLGFVCSTTSSVNPHLVYDPGLELSIQMSQTCTNFRNTAWPSGWLKSSVTYNSLRRSCIHVVATLPVPSLVGSCIPRCRQAASPSPGRSTWITSAPISAAKAAA